MFKRFSFAAVALFAATAPAFAHLPHGEYGSFPAGFSHPLFGLDHILAMVAVGLWASQIGGRALWIVPSAFVGTMAAGFVLALTGASLPFVEPMILASVVILGLLIAMAARLPIGASTAVVGLFAMFHGYAHGGEIGEAGAVAFGAGFAAATALLHAVGIGIGLLVGSGLGLGAKIGEVLSRTIGAGTTIAGIALMVG